MLFFSNSSSFKAIVTLVSQLWSAIIAIVLLPLYVRIIGTESYGLVAFFTTLTASLAILDLGLSTSVSRQLAIMKGSDVPLNEQRSLLYSVEIIYWAVALLLGGLIILLSHPIAAHWVNSRELSVPVIQNAVILMGVALAFQWPMNVYTGALNGLQQQQKTALLSITYTSVRALVLVLALRFVSGTIECFFIVHASLVALQTLISRRIIWKRLSLDKHRPRFSKTQLQKIKKFAFGMTGISLVTFMFSQVDKIVVSKVVLLEFVGYYNLAFTLASIVSQVVGPLQVIFFPKFSTLVAYGEEERLTSAFHLAARWVSIIVIPAGLLLFLFSHEILLLWTKNQTIAYNTSPMLRYIALGTVCNCLMWVPYYYMLAKGNTRFSIYQNIIASVIMTPLLFWWTSRYGALGASGVWFAVNLGYVIFSLPIFHYLYFKGNLKRWYVNNLLYPLVIAGPLFFLAKFIIANGYIEVNFISFGIIIFLVLAAYGFITKEIRQFIIGGYLMMFKRK